MEMTRRLQQMVEEVRLEHAPDIRTAVFEIDVRRENGGWVLVGATSEPAAAEALNQRAGTLESGAEITSRIHRLPRDGAGRTTHALITTAVAPMLDAPRVSNPAISQALSGQRMLVLREYGRWAHCRAEDGYLGWVHRGYFTPVEEAAARQWEMGLDGEACFSLGAAILSEDGEILMRLPWGSRFVLREDGSGLLADGRSGGLTGDWVTERERDQRFLRQGEALVQTARQWMGAPYIWGGITPAGVDCSGLSQSIYRTHGVMLPRDSDQQALCGVEIDPGPDFSELRPGDLLFFEEDPGRISHVTISLGGPQIIHSSLGNGGMAYNDLIGDLHYETELRQIFVTARRILSPES